MVSRLVSAERLRGFFAPRRIAVVGASETSSWGANLKGSLELAGGVKELVFVHPKYPELFGQATVTSLRETDADLAFIMVGPNRVDEVLDDAGAAGIRNAVVLAAGYGETGADGARRQRELAARADELDLTILGPNTIGFINATLGIAPWAVASHVAPVPGPVSAVFESGSMARASYEFAQAHGVGSSLWASVGNSAVLTSLDVVDYLLEDESTESIALFLETVREPARLIELGQRALELEKPIVAFKAGRSAEGKRSAMAHTGAVATDDAVVDAAFRQAGIVRAESIEELVSTAALFGQRASRPAGNRMGVVTSSGGGCNIIADLAGAHALSLPEWRQTTKTEFAEKLPPFAALLNPLDTTGFGHARARPRPTKAEDDLLEIAVQDPGIDFAYSMMTPLPSARQEHPEFIESRMKIIGDMVRASPVPVFLSSNTCLDIADYPRGLLADNGLFLLPGAELAMSAIGNLVRWAQQRERILDQRVSPPTITPVTVPDGTLAEDEARELLEKFGVPTVPARLVNSAEAAAEVEFAGPVAMKICSREIAHKSDIGGVMLNVEDKAAAYSRILRNCAEKNVRGVLVSPMRGQGVEMLVGVTMDPTFGPVLAVGLGGIWVEALSDVSLRVLPVGPATVREMITELVGAPLLRGGRGTEPVDLDALADVIVAISRAALALGDRLHTLEVNPLLVNGSAAEALDALVVTS